MQHHSVNEVLRSLSPGDLEFFPSIVKAIANSTGADIAFVARIDHLKGMAHTLAIHSPGSDIENFSYDLVHTPCADVVGDSTASNCAYYSDVQGEFPSDEMLIDMSINGYFGMPLLDSSDRAIGVLVALFVEPVEESKEIEFLFNSLSGLVSRELVLFEANQNLTIVANVFKNLDEIIVVVDNNLNVISANPAYEVITGHSHIDLIGMPIEKSSFVKNNISLLAIAENFFQESKDWTGEFRANKEDGTIISLSIKVSINRGSDGNKIGYYAVVSDVTHEKNAEKTIHLQANYDSLTALPNRQRFNDRLDQSIQTASREQKQFAVVFMDIDMFKSVNDSLGHNWGDVLLTEVSYRLKRSVRARDTISRFGGDEFTLIIDIVNGPSDVISVLNHIIDAMKEPFVLQSNELYITASLGVAFYPEDGRSREELISHADQAMYSAKHNGRDQYKFFTQDMQLQVEKKLELKNALKTALMQGDLEVYFQPIVNIKNTNRIKLEVLARWNHKGEWIPPDYFIQIAEEFNLISDLDDQILRKSCFVIKQLSMNGLRDVNVCINRSPKELIVNANPAKRWAEIILEHGLDVKNFDIEVTENVLASETTGQFEVIKDLAQAGFKISIDDFGTGYCSLAYLNKFPIDTIKIDKCFISELGKDENQTAIVRAIVALARAMNKEIVAEGIEYEYQQQALEALGCEQFQGFLHSRPLPADELLCFYQNLQQSS